MNRSCFRRRATALAVVGTLGGCAFSNDTQVEIVDYDGAQQTFAFQVATVKTFRNEVPFGQDPVGEPEPTVELPYSPNITNLKGIHVEIRGGGSFGSNLCGGAGATNMTREEFYAANILSEPGPVEIQYNVNPLGVAVASDHDSMFLLSTYTHFDRVRHFFRSTLGDDSRATTTLVVAVFDTEAAVGCRAPWGGGPSLPILIADNAAYAGQADMFVLLRNTFSTATPPGVEFGINPGIIAHEFGHRLFAQNVYFSDAAFRRLVVDTYGSVEDQAKQCEDQTEDDVDDCAISAKLLSGMNEGTADIFAYLYIGTPDFLLPFSFPASELEQRDMAAAPSGEEGLHLYEPVPLLAKEQGWNHYRLGTLWSRGFRAGIVDPRSGAELGSNEEEARVAAAREFHGRALLRALREQGEDFVVNFRFEPRQLVRRYLQQLGQPQGGITPHSNVKSAACQALCDRFGDMPITPVDRAGFPADAQCAGFTGKNLKTEVTFPCTL
ncbi:MAG: hypothetical protein AB2A00_37055 [Myxococcota bacterium]